MASDFTHSDGRAGARQRLRRQRSRAIEAILRRRRRKKPVRPEQMRAAVALNMDRATLVTADERYYRKARKRRAILRLAEYGRA